MLCSPSHGYPDLQQQKRVIKIEKKTTATTKTTKRWLSRGGGALSGAGLFVVSFQFHFFFKSWILLMHIQEPPPQLTTHTHIHTHTHISNILPDRCMCVSVCVSSSVVGVCEIDHWIAFGVWSSAGGVVGSPSTMPSSKAPFKCLLF